MKPILARDVMKKDLVTISPDDTIERLAEVLQEEGVHGLPVVDGKGNAVGVVGRTDLARAVAEQGEDLPLEPGGKVTTTEGILDLEEIEPLHGARLELTGRVADLMSDRVVRAPDTSTVGQLAALMAKEGVHRVLITAGKELVGLVSATDLLGCLTEYEMALERVRPGRAEGGGKRVGKPTGRRTLR
ncbi:MAG TPA: CBS domain-containing protein [Planctomycetota bacterium]|nr:CBS domain-containing protein [Planctomycetota bacterium]